MQRFTSNLEFCVDANTDRLLDRPLRGDDLAEVEQLQAHQLNAPLGNIFSLYCMVEGCDRQRIIELLVEDNEPVLHELGAENTCLNNDNLRKQTQASIG